MVQFKKFMFDNFIVEDEQDKTPQEDEIVESSVPENEDTSAPMAEELVEETTEDISEKEDEEATGETEQPAPQSELLPISPDSIEQTDLADTTQTRLEGEEEDLSLDNMPSEEEIFVEEDEEEIPEEPTYKQEDVDEMVKQAHQQGYDEAVQNTQQGIEMQVKDVFESLNQKVGDMLQSQTAYQHQLEEQTIEIIKQVLNKLVPQLQEEQAQEIVSQFLADNFKNFQHETKLSFYIHPDIISYAQQKIATLANRYDFEGKIALHKDATLAKNDCRVEWDNGGVELNGAKQLSKVINVLETSIDEKPEIQK